MVDKVNFNYQIGQDNTVKKINQLKQVLLKRKQELDDKKQGSKAFKHKYNDFKENENLKNGNKDIRNYFFGNSDEKKIIHKPSPFNPYNIIQQGKKPINFSYEDGYLFPQLEVFPSNKYQGNNSTYVNMWIGADTIFWNYLCSGFSNDLIDQYLSSLRETVKHN